MNPLPLLALALLLAGCTCPFRQSHTQAYPKNQHIQQIADNAADSAMQSLHPKRMAVIVAEPRTGKILAITGRRAGSTAPSDDAVSWIYEPGSTFKPIVAVAALQEGAITPKTKINCENGAFKVAGQTIRDHTGSGDLTYDQILTKSSNIGASKMALMLKDSVYYDYMHRFGFGQRTGIALSGEDAGVVTAPSHWDALSKARMAFGQTVAVTPIQLSMAYCAIANGGVLMKPRTGDEQPAVVTRVCSAKTANAVKKALQGTVSPEGTAPLAHVDGVTVGGKTGTSQALSPHFLYEPDKFTTSFAGFFPVEKPKYVIVVVVDQADLKPEQNYGGLVAAPIFAEIAGKISKLH